MPRPEGLAVGRVRGGQPLFFSAGIRNRAARVRRRPSSQPRPHPAPNHPSSPPPLARAPARGRRRPPRSPRPDPSGNSATRSLEPSRSGSQASLLPPCQSGDCLPPPIFLPRCLKQAQHAWRRTQQLSQSDLHRPFTGAYPSTHGLPIAFYVAWFELDPVHSSRSSCYSVQRPSDIYPTRLHMV